MKSEYTYSVTYILEKQYVLQCHCHCLIIHSLPMSYQLVMICLAVSLDTWPRSNKHDQAEVDTVDKLSLIYH